MRALTDLHAMCWVKRSMCIPCWPCTLPGAISTASQNLLGEEPNVIIIPFSTVTQMHRVLSSRARGRCRCRLML